MDLFVAQPPVNHSLTQKPLDYKNNGSHATVIKLLSKDFCLLYVYKLVVSDKVRHHRIKELKYLFFNRMPEKKSFFKSNELIKSNYEFACKVISAFF